MEATPDLQVYDLGRLGLVRGIVDRIEPIPLVGLGGDGRSST